MQKINLFSGYFKTDNKSRQKELDYCLNKNQNSGLFERVILFDDRPTYNDFFKQTKNYPEDINILCNGDIYFNETLKHVFTMGENDCFALTRSELKDGEIVSFGEMHQYNAEAKAKHSQDVWIFNGEVKKYIDGWFHLGIPGCDNRIAYEILRAKYKLRNPSDIIQAIHVHKEESRNYNLPEGYNKRVPPPYKWVEVGIKTTKPKRFRI